MAISRIVHKTVWPIELFSLAFVESGKQPAKESDELNQAEIMMRFLRRVHQC